MKSERNDTIVDEMMDLRVPDALSPWAAEKKRLMNANTPKWKRQLRGHKRTLTERKKKGTGIKQTREAQ